MKSARGHRRAGSEQRQRDHGDSVWAAVGVAARGEDQPSGEVIDEQIEPDSAPTDERAQLELVARALDRAGGNLLRRRADDARAHRP